MERHPPPRLDSSFFPLRLALIGGGLLFLSLAPQAQAGPSDVSRLYVNKTQIYLQTSTAAPIQQDNPFTLQLGANASSPGTIISGTVQKPPPNNTVVSLNPDGAGNFLLAGGSFATAAALNAAFPNGSYIFNLQTATNPTAFTNSVTISGDSYPVTIPTIDSGVWSSGGLQVDPSQDYFISWGAFSTPFSVTNSGVIFRIVDSAGVVKLSVPLTKNDTSTTIPAGRLQPGQFYTASLLFQNKQVTFANTFNSGVAAYTARTDFTIATIGAIPAVTGPSAPLGTVGQMFIYQIIASDHPFSYDVTNLPPGLTLNATLGIISGVPTDPGKTPATLTADNINGTGAKTDFAATIQPAPSQGPVIISNTSALGYAGQPFIFHVVTKGATSAARITATGLRPGLTLDAVTGVISGNTNSVGSFSVNLTVKDGSFTATGFLQLTFTADADYPVITNADIVTVPRNTFFSYKIATPGANDPTDPPRYDFVGNLPQGLQFDPETGTISGTYTGPLSQKRANGSDDGPPDVEELSGGALLGSIQLFGANSHGTSTFQLLFLAPPSGAVNIATRLLVGTGENVLIGGFIVTGNAPKVVILRAIGPSIGIPAAMQDPMLELHDSAGGVVSNDNWRTTQEQIIKDTTIPPTDDRESAIVVSLNPGNYTAIVSGKDGGTGIALVELYDLGTASADTASNAKLAQISTRGKVLQGDNVMIGGFIVSGVPTKIIARAIGPSLSQFGIADALSDTTIDLVNSNGATIGSNDDWRSDQEQAIKDTTVPPTDNRESAIVTTLDPGAYTAIVRGKGNATGVALVEVYGLQ